MIFQVFHDWYQPWQSLAFLVYHTQGAGASKWSVHFTNRSTSQIIVCFQGYGPPKQLFGKTAWKVKELKHPDPPWRWRRLDDAMTGSIHQRVGGAFRKEAWKPSECFRHFQAAAAAEIFQFFLTPPASFCANAKLICYCKFPTKKHWVEVMLNPPCSEKKTDRQTDIVRLASCQVWHEASQWKFFKP